jgi:PhnB protein
VPTNPPAGYPRVAPYLLYEDPEAALAWLQAAFGFRERFRHVGEERWINHAELELGDGVVMLARPDAAYRSPARLGGATALVHVYVDRIHEHFEQALAAGAVVRTRPHEEPYGTIQYSVADPEGHLWLFSEQVREPDPPWRLEAPE